MTGRPKKSPFLFVNQKIPTNKGPNRKGLYLMTIIVILIFKNHPINYFLRPITHPDPISGTQSYTYPLGAKLLYNI